MKKFKVRELAFYIVLIYIMLMSMFIVISEYTSADYSLKQLLVYNFVFTSISVLVYILPVALFAIPILSIIYALFNDSKTLFRNYLEFFIWLQQYIRGYDSFNYAYSGYFLVLVGLLCSMIISLLTFKEKCNFALIVFGVCFFGFFWFNYTHSARLYVMVFLLCALTRYIFGLFQRKILYWQKSGFIVEKGLAKSWFISGGIITVLSIILALMLPLNIRPIELDNISEIFTRIFPFTANWRSEWRKSEIPSFNSQLESILGRKNTKKLGGPVENSDTVLATIETDGFNMLYMRGSVKDKYTGHSWLYSRISDRVYVCVPSREFMSFFGEGVETYVRKIKITNKKLDTSTALAPYCIKKASYGDIEFNIVWDIMEVYFTKKVKPGESYTTESIIPVIDEADLRTKALNKENPNKYLQLPSNISENIKSLAESITNAYTNDYDKVKAVERYLRENYKYNLKPKRVPPGKEFTEYFLFEEKEGYCTYFATAMAVLLRSAGIPCRYVEGFFVQGSSGQNGVYNIKAKDAHAWVEVNFKDYGWVTFEPTPAYPASTSPNSQVSETSNKDTNHTAQLDNRKIYETVDSLKRLKESLDGEDEAAYTNTSEEVENSNKTLFLLVAMYFLTAIILARILYLIYIFKVRKKAALKRDMKLYIKVFYYELIWVLKLMGHTIDKSSTIRELLKEANKFINYYNIEEIISIIEKYNYGNNKLNETDIITLEHYINFVKKEALKRTGKLRYAIKVLSYSEKTSSST